MRTLRSTHAFFWRLLWLSAWFVLLAALTSPWRMSTTLHFSLFSCASQWCSPRRADASALRHAFTWVSRSPRNVAPWTACPSNFSLYSTQGCEIRKGGPMCTYSRRCCELSERRTAGVPPRSPFEGMERAMFNRDGQPS